MAWYHAHQVARALGCDDESDEEEAAVAAVEQNLDTAGESGARDAVPDEAPAAAGQLPKKGTVSSTGNGVAATGVKASSGKPVAAAAAPTELSKCEIRLLDCLSQISRLK